MIDALVSQVVCEQRVRVKSRRKEGFSLRNGEAQGTGWGDDDDAGESGLGVGAAAAAARDDGAEVWGNSSNSGVLDGGGLSMGW